MALLFSEELKRFKAKTGLTQDEIARVLGISVRMYQYYEKGDYDGNEGKVKRYMQLLSSYSESKPPKGNAGTPVYDIDVTAGNGFDFSNQLPETIKGYINLPNFKRCIAFIMVKGDSMYPKFKAGDLIGLEPVIDIDIIQWGQTYVVLTKDNQRLLKYLRKGRDEEHLILRSENDKYDDMMVHKQKVQKLFMAKGPVRDDWQ